MMEKQKYSSKNTSVNSKKVPKIFKKIKWSPGTTNLDWGGGKYNTATEYLESLGCYNYIYDPYNRSSEHNATVLSAYDYDTVTISNVLNVISEPEFRVQVVTRALGHLKSGGILYITVYEGNHTGKGKESKKGCWQNNASLSFYMQELQRFSPIKKNGMIIIKNQ